MFYETLHCCFVFLGLEGPIHFLHINFNLVFMKLKFFGLQLQESMSLILIEKYSLKGEVMKPATKLNFKL